MAGAGTFLISGKTPAPIGAASEDGQQSLEAVLVQLLETNQMILEELRRIRLGMSILVNEELEKETVDAG